MKLKVGKYGEGKVFKFGDGELTIRPYPASMSTVQGNADGYVIISGEDQLKAFKFCLMGWKNFTDEETGKDIELTEKVKDYIYDYPELKDDDDTLISVFVLQKGRVAAETLDEEAGN